MPDEIARRRHDRVTHGEIQAMVDRLSAPGSGRLSSSRISSIVNAIRSMDRWAKDHEVASNDPAKEIRLPASDAQQRDRVATPAEFARLIKAIFEPTPAELEKGEARDRDQARKDALPFALAGYASARRQEIQVLDWTHINLDVGAGELAGDEEGRKPGGSWRLVPFVKPLWEMLREEWVAQGHPSSGKVCPPKAIRSSGLLAVSTLQTRVQKRWREQGLRPIGLHESRHTTATWLDHAGVSPKVISEFMGTRPPNTSSAPPGSPSSDTPTCCPASWSEPALSSTSSWPRGQVKTWTRSRTATCSPPDGARSIRRAVTQNSQRTFAVGLTSREESRWQMPEK